jgi:hypothetical protein
MHSKQQAGIAGGIAVLTHTPAPQEWGDHDTFGKERMTYDLNVYAPAHKAARCSYAKKEHKTMARKTLRGTRNPSRELQHADDPQLDIASVLNTGTNPAIKITSCGNPKQDVKILRTLLPWKSFPRVRQMLREEAARDIADAKERYARWTHPDKSAEQIADMIKADEERIEAGDQISGCWFPYNPPAEITWTLEAVARIARARDVKRTHTNHPLPYNPPKEISWGDVFGKDNPFPILPKIEFPKAEYKMKSFSEAMGFVCTLLMGSRFMAPRSAPMFEAHRKQASDSAFWNREIHISEKPKGACENHEWTWSGHGSYGTEQYDQEWDTDNPFWWEKLDHDTSPSLIGQGEHGHAIVSWDRIVEAVVASARIEDEWD